MIIWVLSVLKKFQLIAGVFLNCTGIQVTVKCNYFFRFVKNPWQNLMAFNMGITVWVLSNAINAINLSFLLLIQLGKQ